MCEWVCVCVYVSVACLNVIQTACILVMHDTCLVCMQMVHSIYPVAITLNFHAKTEYSACDTNIWKTNEYPIQYVAANR